MEPQSSLTSAATERGITKADNLDALLQGEEGIFRIDSTVRIDIARGVGGIIQHGHKRDTMLDSMLLGNGVTGYTHKVSFVLGTGT